MSSRTLPLLRLAVGVPLGLIALTCGGAPEPHEPYDIELREAWIPMPDGVRLAADLYMPAGAASAARFPVLLEYLPYRKTESRGSRYSHFSYFVERGYVVARVDIRGTGNSEGKLVAYEYTDQEQEDAEAVIDWLAKQPFSNGRVGMFGISWGGFNSIHLAMRNPPALKAIVALMATDDLFLDDVHFIDGILHFDSYEIGQDVENSLPSAPAFDIDERLFRDRFDTTPWLLVYKQQQRDGPFWDRASLNTRYDSIRVPTFVIGGWYDGYRDSVPRMLEHLRSPVKALLGPWGHAYPNDPYPEPGMEWRHEAVRWFDHWLRDRDTGILEEPRFAVYVRHWHPPGQIEEAPGEWRWEEGWPLARAEERELYAHPDHSLRSQAPSSATHELDYVPSSGIEAGGSVMWWGDFMPDQQPTDDQSLVYDSEPLGDDLEILGFPRAVLQASASAPLAHWFARLSDVAPDGQVTQVTGAGQNGAHRTSAEQPESLEPGREYRFEVEQHMTSWVFPRGHRIRLSISNAQWPMFWPTPYPMTSTLRLGGDDPTRLFLPVVPFSERPHPAFLPPAEDPTLPGHRSLDGGTISGYAELAQVNRDPERGTTSVAQENAYGDEYPWGTIEHRERIVHETSDRNPEATSVLGDYHVIVKLPERTLDFQGVLDVKSDRDSLFFTYTRRLTRDGELVHEKVWSERIRRDFQ